METWQFVVATIHLLGFLVTAFLFLTDRIPDDIFLNLGEFGKIVYVFICALLWPLYLAFFIFMTIFILGDF